MNNPSFPRVSHIVIETHLADGRVHITKSAAGRITSDGVSINTDQKILTDDIASSMIDVRQTTTVQWTEEWTEMVK